MKKNADNVARMMRRWISCFRRRKAGCDRDWNLLKELGLAEPSVKTRMPYRQICVFYSVPVRRNGKGGALPARIGGIAISKGVMPIHFSKDQQHVCRKTSTSKWLPSWQVLCSRSFVHSFGGWSYDGKGYVGAKGKKERR